MNTQRLKVLSLGENHAAAIGALGELYVWGLNTEGQLGFDTDTKGFEKPTYLHIENEFYKFKALEVCCGDSFTAIYGRDRHFIPVEEPKLDPLRTSTVQLDDFDNPIKKQSTKELLIIEVNKTEQIIQNTIESYMDTHNLSMLDIFKTPKMKDFSFIRLLTQKIKVPLTPKQIRSYINERNMRTAGLNVDLNHLFELIEGQPMGQGALFIMGYKGIPRISVRGNDSLHGEYIYKKDIKYFLCKFKDRFTVCKISCGGNFLIALAVGGIVYTWGEVVGPINDRTYSTAPERVQFEKNDIIDVAAGNYHCVALTSKGAVYTWGSGSFGSLGFESPEDLKLPRNVLATVGDIQISKIYAGFSQTICVPIDGGAMCWGNNRLYQFGTKESARLPIALGYTGIIIACAISENYTVIINDQGKLMKAGGQNSEFKPVGDESLDEKVFCHVTSNRFMVAALTQDGCLYTFRYDKGASGNELLARPVTLSNPEDQPCEVTSCNQQLYNTIVYKPTDELAEKTPKGIIQICCGDINTYSVTSQGEVLVCGSNSHGQLARVRAEEEESKTDLIEGDSEEDNEDIENSSFLPILHLTKLLKVKIMKLATGHLHVFAITTDKKLYAWGNNREGQLGLNTLKPMYHIPTLVEAFKEIPLKQAAGGENHSLVLTEEGEVFSFGSAECGKLGLGPVKPKTLYHSPIHISTISDIKHISCGDNHSLAISNDNLLYTWGDGWKGQLGNGGTDNLYEPTSISASCEFKTGDCGSVHTAAIDTDNKIWHWGDAESVASDNPVLTPQQCTAIENMNFTQISCGEKFTLALTDNCKIYAWGKPRKYRLSELENRKEEDKSYLPPTIIYIDDTTKITQVSAGRIHCAAVGYKGEVYTWGFAGNGRLGDSDAKLQNMCKINPSIVECVSEYLGLFKENEDHDDLIEEDEEKDRSLQECLLNQREELNETIIRENDKSVMGVLEQCIDIFVKIADNERSENEFYDLADHKMLNRIQLKPFNCTFIDPTSIEESEFEMNRVGYEALLTTLQLHPCYVYKLIYLKSIKNEPKTLLDNIYIEMENDKRLIYTAIYLAQMILTKELAEHPNDLSFFKNKEASLYRHLFSKIIAASQEDMNGMRSIALDCINLLVTQIGEDKHAVSINPNIPNKGDLNPITAYSLNRQHVDKRINKLHQVMEMIIVFFKGQIRQVHSSGVSIIRSKMSAVTILLMKDFKKQVCRAQGKNPFNARTDAPSSFEGTHVALDILFSVLYEIIKEPIVNLVPTETNIKNHKYNLASLSNELKAFFAGEFLGREDFRWLKKIQDLNQESEKGFKVKRNILEIIFSENANLEEEFVNSTFEHSLSNDQVQISICLYPLVQLHRLIKDNIDIVRVSTRSYDPICLILENLLKLEPRVRNVLKNQFINLNLMTKVLRRDQSLARCPDCGIIVPREMAPTNYKPIYELFEPMPPSSATAIMTEVLSKGPKISEKLRMEDYILNFKERCRYITHDFELEDKIDGLLNEININILSEDTGSLTSADIQKKTEKQLKDLEQSCREFYNKRKEHFKMQEKISRTFTRLLNYLTQKMYKGSEEGNSEENHMSSGNIPDKIKRHTLFNLEYGACNRELEEYSDTVTFKLFLNEVRKATSSKDISIELFENIKKSMAKDLKAFQCKNFKSLVKSGVIVSYELDNFKPNNVEISFEVDQEKIVLIGSHKKAKFSLCGGGEFSEEILLFNESIPAGMIKEWRDQLRTNPELS